MTILLLYRAHDFSRHLINFGASVQKKWRAPCPPVPIRYSERKGEVFSTNDSNTYPGACGQWIEKDFCPDNNIMRELDGGGSRVNLVICFQSNKIAPVNDWEHLPTWAKRRQVNASLLTYQRTLWLRVLYRVCTTICTYTCTCRHQQ